MARLSRKVSESKTVVARVMMPQDANIAGNVFGGAILKAVDEVAYVAATKHVRANVVTVSLDSTSFLSPVRIGDLLTLKASVNAVWRSSMEVGVRVEAEDPKTGGVRHTGSSYITVVALDDSGKPREAPDLILETPEDDRRSKEALRRRKRRLEERNAAPPSHE
ncbi:MAG: acyl-CoA thioesterase [Methanobacteriota archaeon]|nr:MAG: acyl-CoA thioesterase [Euryarchaeota archaeon]